MLFPKLNYKKQNIIFNLGVLKINFVLNDHWNS
jgi:hypothetical protein